jgi:hypothetical protein
MTDDANKPATPSDTAAKAKLALEMKRKAAQTAHPKSGARWDERSSAARSASKSKPKLRK